MNNRSKQRSFGGGRAFGKNAFLAMAMGILGLGTMAPASASQISTNTQQTNPIKPDKVAQPIGQLGTHTERRITPGRREYRHLQTPKGNQRQRRKLWASNPHTRKKYGR